MGVTAISRPARVLPVACLALFFSCEPTLPTARRRADVPKMQATVIDIRTVTQPDNRTTDHSIVIAGDQARSTDELDRWRLFDLKNETVTFVDDLAKTRRTEPIASLLARRRRTLSLPVDEKVPRAEFSTTAETRPVLGIPASQSVITAGGYRRELWIGTHPQIPPRLFALMQISDPPSSPLAPMMKSADEALVNVRGFPLVDRSELPVGESRMTVERSVAAVGVRNVPQSLLKIPADYRDLTRPATKPRARRPPAASPPPGQKAPEAGSRSFSRPGTDP